MAWIHELLNYMFCTMRHIRWFYNELAKLPAAFPVEMINYPIQVRWLISCDRFEYHAIYSIEMKLYGKVPQHNWVWRILCRWKFVNIEIMEILCGKLLQVLSKLSTLTSSSSISKRKRNGCNLLTSEWGSRIIISFNLECQPSSIASTWPHEKKDIFKKVINKCLMIFSVFFFEKENNKYQTDISFNFCVRESL